MNTFRNLAMFTALLLSWNIFANETVSIGNVEMANEKKSDAFEQVRKKIGKWKGTMVQGIDGNVIDVSYEFALTSGGNTITETLIEDGVQMLTTYSDDDGELDDDYFGGKAMKTKSFGPNVIQFAMGTQTKSKPFRF